MNSMRMRKAMTLEDEPPRSEGIQCAAGEEQRAIMNSSRKNEDTEPKRKQCPIMDVTGDVSKV